MVRIGRVFQEDEHPSWIKRDRRPPQVGRTKTKEKNKRNQWETRGNKRKNKCGKGWRKKKVQQSKAIREKGEVGRRPTNGNRKKYSDVREENLWKLLQVQARRKHRWPQTSQLSWPMASSTQKTIFRIDSEGNRKKM